MKKCALALIFGFLLGADCRAVEGKPREIWMPFRDRPTAVFPHEKDYRVFFADHAGVYYLPGSDPTLKLDLSRIKEAIRLHQEVTAEAEATYLFLRKIKPVAAGSQN
jgi:hypothetical protein